MAPLPWLVVLEQMAYQQLMKSPTFHRGVEQVVKFVHRARHGEHPDDMGGTKIDAPSPRFGKHFVDELRTQLGQAEKEQARIQAQRPQSQSQSQSQTTEPHDAEAAWRHIQQQQQPQQTSESTELPKQGSTSDYLSALRGQVSDKKPPP